MHFYRNVFSLVPKGRVGEVADMLNAIHAQEDLEAAQPKSTDVVTKLRAMKLDKSVIETLTYYHFPREHRRRLRTNNPLERILREVRRRMRVVGAFPDGNSALMLVAARLRYFAGTNWGTRRYLRMNLLKEMNQEATA